MLLRSPCPVSVLVLALASACDPSPAPEYLAVGAKSVEAFERGTYSSSNPHVLRVTARDVANGGCSGITLFGCPGQEISVQRTELTLEALAEGRAELHGKLEDGDEVVIPYKVELIRTFDVRTVNGSDNEDRGTPVPEGDVLTLAVGATELLQINALGASNVPLGYVEPIRIAVLDESIATVTHALYSRGWRATVKATSTGTTLLRIDTERATRELEIRVTPAAATTDAGTSP